MEVAWHTGNRVPVMPHDVHVTWQCARESGTSWQAQGVKPVRWHCQENKTIG